jgi:hypothetical protein
MQSRDSVSIPLNGSHYEATSTDKVVGIQSSANVSLVAPSIARCQCLHLEPQTSVKHDMKQRWIILPFACMIMFGLYYL